MCSYHCIKVVSYYQDFIFIIGGIITYEHVIHCSGTDDDDDDDDDGKQESISFWCLNDLCVCVRACVRACVCVI